MTRYAATVLFALCAASAWGDTDVRQPGIRVAHYTFDLAVGDVNDELVMTETVDVRFLSAGVTSVDLDLCRFTAQPRPPLTADQRHDPCAEPRRRGPGAPPSTPTGAKGMTVTSVAIDNRPATFTH